MIAPSSRLGPYEMVMRVGAGGMGEVWRARDTRIGRDVAVKILPPEFVASADRLRRFEQESRSAGSISHPNLVTIHDVGTHDGTPYIVMELLEGETLRDRIGSDGGPKIPIRKAIEVSVQIANGLAAAHDKGIVHRDLKPENIFIMPDGRVKILDFGLAKLTVVESDDSQTQQRDTSPGAVVGTAGYMSPEQVRGHDVDHRTDIFAFGAILYEILTGRRAFRRPSSVETMNAILNDDPPEIASSAHHVAPAIDRIVRRCLEKNRTERFQSARDLAFALEAVSGSSLSHEAAPLPLANPTSSRPKIIAAVLGAAVFAAAVTAAYLAGRRDTTAPLSPRFTQLTFSAEGESSPAIAPNGETFAFVRDGDIHLQRIDGRNSINLTRTPDTREAAPAFSPDGKQIAFNTGDGIFVMGATGESIRRITSAGYDPTWSPDGKQIAFSRDEPTVDARSRNTNNSALMVVDAAGGTPKKIIDDAMQPRWSPDGERIAFWTNSDAGQRDISTVGVTGGKESIVPVTSDIALDWSPAWSPDGEWLYFSSDRNGTTSLWRVAIDSASGKTRGQPQLIPAPSPHAGWISVASDGKNIVFESRTYSNALYTSRFDQATETLTVDETPVLDGSLLVRAAAASPDGSMIAFTTEGREDLFVMKNDGSDLRQLTNDDARDRGATWTPDGKIGFYSARSGTYQIWTIRPDGSELRQISAVSEDKLPNFPSFSPDGRKVAAPALERGAWIADLSTLPVTNVDVLPRPEANLSFFPQSWSPDGLRIAGRPWGPHEKIYVYSVAERTFRKVIDGYSRASFIDANRLLLGGSGKIAVHDLRTGNTREIWRGAFETSQAISQADHLVLEHSRVEHDVWLATLP